MVGGFIQSVFCSNSNSIFCSEKWTTRLGIIPSSTAEFLNPELLRIRLALLISLRANPTTIHLLESSFSVMMPNATGNAVPVYFEESWAILSSIGLVNVLLGLMVIGITTLSPLVLVPIVTSVAGSIANGLCYYAFYANYPTTGTVVAAAVADVAWLIQEAGIHSTATSS